MNKDNGYPKITGTQEQREKKKYLLSNINKFRQGNSIVLFSL